MKNKEKYFDEILNIFISNNRACDFKAKNVLKTNECKPFGCVACSNATRKWLEQEYKEPIKLTEDEKAILRNVDKRYKYIVRSFGMLEVFEAKPYRTLGGGLGS